jgi:6-pyruvoyltetrahydropterin/6-carboxytetrahydropterin synthase
MTEAPRVTVFRKEHFNAAHRLHNPLWTAEKTKKYSFMQQLNYHGHNYEILS